MCCVCGGGCDCDPEDPTCDCAHPCPDGGCDELEIDEGDNDEEDKEEEEKED